MAVFEVAADIMANRRKKSDFARCRVLLGLAPDPAKIEKRSAQERMLELTGEDLTRCPCCKHGRMLRVRELPKPTSNNFAPWKAHPASRPRRTTDASRAFLSLGGITD